MDAIVIFCTVPDRDDAKKISKALIEENLAACVSTVDKVSSLFSWNGEMCSENELLLIIKTKRELFEKIEAVIKALHSYNVPEIIGLPVIVGSEDYLGWIEHETL
ncbi:divalent-cation tolerance protein CutA [bacterium]|nr:divalent-cation tolerance protein CutA [bacterium]